MIIAITGTMGSGKTTLSRYIEEQGFSVIFADAIARELTEPGKVIYQNILSQYGHEILDGSGRIDRSKLATIVFSDKERVEELNKITHPFVVQEIFHKAKHLEERAKAGLIFVELPLLIESGFYKLAQKVILVSARSDVKLERLQKSGITEEDAKRRLTCQKSEAEYREHSDEVLDNNGDPAELYALADELLARLCAHA